MNKITTHLWFDTQAKEAAEFHTSVFPESKIDSISQLKNTPSGDCDVVAYTVWGHSFMSISAGPYFKINPSISFLVNFDPSQNPNAASELDRIWEALLDGGKILMPLDAYPFSERYGWVEDKYGVSWQLMLTNPEGEPRPNIIPSLLFVGEMSGKAEGATEHYLSVFKDSRRGQLVRWPAGMEPEKEGTVMFTDIMLLNQWFTAMDSGANHEFAFNEGVSFLVNCDTQDEIDYYWEKLSAHPESEQCGWLKDRWGVSWQISPTLLNEVMATGTQEQIDRVTQAFLPMKKLDIAKIKEAYEAA